MNKPDDTFDSKAESTRLTTPGGSSSLNGVASVESSRNALFAAKVLPERDCVDQAVSVRGSTILLELRPALDGFAGIPQETRLLFRGLRMIDEFNIEGMIQTSSRRLARGTTRRKGLFSRQLSEARTIDRYSRIVISLADRPFRTVLDRVGDFFERKLQASTLTVASLLGLREVKLTDFRSRYFEDFIWRTLFSKTLPASDRGLISSANQRICSVPWHTMHMVGLKSLSIMPTARYLRMNTEDVDVFIAQTPFPGRVSKNTGLVVRYHDAIPVFMPHTIPNKSEHQATHFHALANNVRAGAWFACVSEATRRDLLRLFPQAEPRAVTIHNMVSHHYYPENSDRALVPGIIRSRLYEGNPGMGGALKPEFLSLREQEAFYRRHLSDKPLKYLIMVSTIEPRKNHARLMAAWEVLKAEVDPDIKLVVVGTLGWDYKGIVSSFRPWIDRGELFPLASVPAPDLRVLYRHAVATVCPSLGEGFDFSGIEAMRSGGVVLASDIPVHREVYEDASEYFDPYATASLVKALRKVIYAEDAGQVQAHLRQRGAVVSSRYLPENILPRWRAFLDRVLESQREGRVVSAAKLRVERQDVVEAFRSLLGRDPENEGVIEAHRHFETPSELREALMQSDEYKARLGRLKEVHRVAEEAISSATLSSSLGRPLPEVVAASGQEVGAATGIVVATASQQPALAGVGAEGASVQLMVSGFEPSGSASVSVSAAGGETSNPISRSSERSATSFDVMSAFRELLGREPESQQTIDNHLRHGSIEAVRAVIKASPEYRARRDTAQQSNAKWVCTEVLGDYTMWVDLNDRFVSQGCLQGAWEAEETDFFRSVLAVGQTVLDIGANIGWYSLVAARCIGPGGVIHAFEPRPDTAAMLRKTVAGNRLQDRIRVWELALDDHAGTRGIAWEPASRNPGHSFLVGGDEPVDDERVVELARVKVATLDDVLPDVRADVIKIDVEGAEPRVMAGAQQLLAKGRPLILSELFPEQLRGVSGVGAADYIARMEAFGYCCYLLESGRPGRRLRDFPADATRELVSVVFDPLPRH